MPSMASWKLRSASVGIAVPAPARRRTSTVLFAPFAAAECSGRRSSSMPSASTVAPCPIRALDAAARALIGHGATVDALGMLDERRPLHSAAAKGAKSTVEVLLRAGAGTAMPTEAERNFHEAMLGIYRRAKAEAGYNANRFLGMVVE